MNLLSSLSSLLPLKKHQKHHRIRPTILVVLLLLVVSSRRCVASAWTTTTTTTPTTTSRMITSSSTVLLRKTLLVAPPVLPKVRPHALFIRLAATTSSFSTQSSEQQIQDEQDTTTTMTSALPLQRLSKQNLSMDLKTIGSHLNIVQSHLSARRSPPETLEAAQQLASSTELRVQLIQQRDQFLAQRKDLSAQVGKLNQQLSSLSEDDENKREEIQLLLEQVKQQSIEATDNASHVDDELDVLQQQMDTLLAGLPNLLDDRVPDGDTDQDNVIVSTWGDIAALPKQLEWPDTFQPSWHDDVATRLGGYQAEAAVKLSGARFVALSGVIARLERALAMFFVDLHTQQHGYTEVSVPLIVSRSTLEGTSQLPKFQEDLFAITPTSHTCNGEDAFLIPTAEVPVTNLHRDSVLDENDLPLCYVSYTPCFRAEAGSYGRDTKGLIRTHQFYKVELVKITTPHTSDAEHELLTQHAEACLQALQLPYRKVRLCSGDIGFAAQHCYDLEVWLPGAGEYREISSCSNCGDFQARRMSLRYRPKPGSESGGKNKKLKPQLCHTINGSGLAVGRTLVAVLENYQRPDGSVVVPEVLRPYMGGKTVLEVPAAK